MFFKIKDSSGKWLILLNNEIPQNCNKKQIIESLAYKLFFTTILKSVMQNEVVLPYLDALNTLLNIEENL